MLIVVSPAKSLDYASPLPSVAATQPEFMQQSAHLVERMRDFTPADLSSLMSISSKLADLNFGRFLEWQPKADQENARPAVFAFTGDVYQGLQANTLTAAQLDYAQQHLRILSGLYGVLRPLDLMQPYRLEMGTKLKTEQGDNLYKFWGDTITDALNRQMAQLGTDTLLNLASNEYFSAVNPKQLQGQIVAPVFKDCKAGNYKIISFYAKKARGLMSRWIIENGVESADQLKDFSVDGYYYHEAESSLEKPLFRREEA